MIHPTPIKIVECPRDAMQGWSSHIPTAQKVAYINALLQVGFHTIDFGSFVSPKAIPQMADTKAVLAQLNYNSSRSALLAIVANIRGAQEAVQYSQISYLGFPFSISETFQQRNTNSSIATSFDTVDAIQELCVKHQKELVVYLSMAFGNPYGDAHSIDVLLEYAYKMQEKGIKIISLADTIGAATPEQITSALQQLIPTYTEVEFGVHLHTTHTNWQQKLAAAIQAGCTRIDGAINGIGGCPMADDVLVGNLNTLHIIDYLQQQQLLSSINKEKLRQAVSLADNIFAKQH
jgi:hydroxymethylglutaryl-CoA lyase